MQIIPIVPFQLMQKASKLSFMSMYLYHLFKHKSYQKQYKQDTNYKILDSGVFELGRLPPIERYLRLISQLLPDEVIAPDVPGDYQKTFQLVVSFIQQLRKLNQEINIQCVIQAKTLDDAIHCYKNYSNNPDIYCIGFPYRLKLENGEKIFNRQQFIDYLDNFKIINKEKIHHLLGAISIKELTYLSKYSYLRSCDTSLVYLDSRRMINYKKVLPQKRHHDIIDFFDEKALKFFSQFQKNLNFLRNSSKKKVALVNPPYSTYLYTKEKNLKSILPPLGLLYLHAYCRNDAEIKLFDGELYSSFKKLIMDLKQFGPHIIGYTATSPTYPVTKKISSNFKGKCLQIIGGTYATVADEEVVKDFELVMRQEGEETLKSIIRGEYIDSIEGLSYTKNNKLIRTKNRKLRMNLDELPFPSWDVVDFDKYQPSAHRNTAKRFAVILTSRGCYFSCMYCSTKLINGPIVRLRSPKNVYDEISLLKNKYNINHFQIWDDTFTFDKPRLREICMLLKPLDITYSCNTRPDYFQDEDAKLLSESGCTSVFFGVESGDEDILRYYGRTMSLEKIKKSFFLCHKFGIKTTASFMIGAPIETKKSLSNTLKFAKSLKSDYVLFNILTPHKKTRLYNDALQNKLIEPYDIDLKKYREEPVGMPILKNLYFDRTTLQKIKKQLYKEYYLSIRYVFQQLLRSQSMADMANTYKIIRTYSK